MTEENTAEKDKKSWKARVRPWTWRLPVAVVWLEVLGIPLGVDLGLVSLTGIVVSGVAFRFAISDNRWISALGIVFFFPLYLILFPLWALLSFAGTTSEIVFETGRLSNDPVRALGPLITSILIVFALLLPVPSNGAILIIAVSAANILVIVLGIVGWIIEPIPWVLALGRTVFDWYKKLRPEMEFEWSDVKQGNAAAMRSYRKYAEKLTEWYENMVNGLEQAKAFDRTAEVLTLGFARKFLFAVVHVGLMLGAIAYALNSSAVSAGAFPDLTSDISSWYGAVEYLSFGLLALLGSATDLSPPRSIGAFVYISCAAVVGVSLLVTLVTAFSMLGVESAERIRSEVIGILAAERDIAEGLLMDLATDAKRHAVLETKVYETLPATVVGQSVSGDEE